MSPETVETLKNMQTAVRSMYSDLAERNYGIVKMKLEEMSAKIAVQLHLFNVDLDNMEPKVIDCINIDDDEAV